ncbi:MAG: hypothetical protein ACKVW3_09090 [Phycisphaerales bacterium]
MIAWLRHLDRLLRGEYTSTDALSAGRFELSLRIFVPLAVILGGIYGFFMGWFALTRSWGTGSSAGAMQMIASTIKIPALFLLTLLVTLPSLYVFNAFIGTRLTFTSVVRLLIAAIVVNVAVAASFGTILAFFTLSTTSYSFMVVLNVALLGVAGGVGLGFLLAALRRLSPQTPVDPAQPAAAKVSPADGIFYIWVLIYSLVGAQMGWLLRPFIGHPAAPFQWFRPRSGNFFEAFFYHLSKMLGS